MDSSSAAGFNPMFVPSGRALRGLLPFWPRKDVTLLCCSLTNSPPASGGLPAITYPRVNSSGEVVQVTRKPFTRRTIKPDVWKYHLQKMAVADDPIEYLCRFLPAADQVLLHDSDRELVAAHG
jgi:hypothetical protein